MPDVAALLALYDTQLRGHVDVFPEGVHAQKDGPLLRVVGAKHGGFVGYRDLAGLDGAELNELIARQVGVFSDRGERFEWKLHGHDRPAHLGRRLRGAGFVPEDVETVVIADVGSVAGDPRQLGEVLRALVRRSAQALGEAHHLAQAGREDEQDGGRGNENQREDAVEG